ncbi:MAG: hypothetical protein LUQ26_10640 [Methylococcaceae bacterium]|nr:hypothetical protein [Methylococcaceae bacterium]
MSSAAIDREGKSSTSKIELYFEQSGIFSNLKDIEEKIDKNTLNFICNSKEFKKIVEQ